MARRKVLVIEDDDAVRQGVVDALEFAGYAVMEAADGPDGLATAIRSHCEIVLLDLVLPGGDGLDILQEVRRTRPRLPVIIMTARGGEEDRVAGLRLGADDYVVKPFSVRELLARVEAVLRRSAERPLDVRRVPLPEGTADLACGQVEFTDGSRQDLTEREGDLLRYLATNAGRPINREELLSAVWRINPVGIETRTVDVHVARLREKLRDDSSDPRIIRTVRGRGYMFEPQGASP
jgi:DNA-binding response OmpR family regulator